MKYFKTISKMAVVMVMFLIFTAGNSFATLSSYWDLAGVNITGSDVNDSDHETGVFDQIGYLANFNTIQYDTDGSTGLSVGDVYLSKGNVRATDLIASSVIDKEGLNTVSGYEFTFVLTDLVGIVSGISPNITTTDGQRDLVINAYTGGTIDMYISNTVNSDYNSTLDLTDDSGFSDGLKVATITDVHGVGTSLFEVGTANFLTGSYDIEGAFLYLHDDFWYAANGEDLLEKLVSLHWMIGTSDGNIDKVVQEFNFADHGEGFSTDYGNVLYTIDSDSNASFELSAVPEPATMTMLGFGLLGLAGVGRKRFKK